MTTTTMMNPVAATITIITMTMTNMTTIMTNTSTTIMTTTMITANPALAVVMTMITITNITITTMQMKYSPAGAWKRQRHIPQKKFRQHWNSSKMQKSMV
jgi:hypothetical protein